MSRPRRQPCARDTAGGRRWKDEINHVVLTGILAADARECLLDGDEAGICLLISFPAPDGCGLAASGVVEVPLKLAESRRHELRGGTSVLVAGQIDNGGCIRATLLETGAPTPSELRRGTR